MAAMFAPNSGASPAAPGLTPPAIPNTQARGMTIAAEGPQKYGAIFAGLRLDPASQRLTVYVTSHDNAAETDMRQNLPAGSVDFTIVPRSQAQLLGFHDRINADWVRLQETGHLVISSAGPDPATGREQIGVVDLTPPRRCTSTHNSARTTSNFKPPPSPISLMPFRYATGQRPTESMTAQAGTAGTSSPTGPRTARAAFPYTTARVSNSSSLRDTALRQTRQCGTGHRTSGSAPQLSRH
jgi:hypothetical protein